MGEDVNCPTVHMTDMTDFSDLSGSLPDDETYRASLAAPRLEERFPGLTFERDLDKHRGWGSVPVQAYATRGDQRLYFRFRQNTATLSVWSIDTPVSEYGLPLDDPDLYATIHDVVPGDTYLGFLTPDQAFELFVRLMDELSPPDPETNPTYRHRMDKAMAYFRARDAAREAAGE